MVLNGKGHIHHVVYSLILRVSVLFELKRVNNLPVFLHVHDGPSAVECFVERLVQATNVGLTIIGPLVLCVSMVEDERISCNFSGRTPLYYL